jgi:hypothetical protein
MKCKYLCTLFFILLVFSCTKEPQNRVRDFKTVGASACYFLSAGNYPSLTVEISYMPGYGPDAGAINNLHSFLARHLNKPAGINIVLKELPASGETVLTLGEVQSLEKRYRSIYSDESNIAAHILIVDADYDNHNIQAFSYYNTSICIFGKTISDHFSEAGERTYYLLLSTLMQHEFGHLLGLVGWGSPIVMSHQDPANGHHCTNPKCLMYYSINSTMYEGITPSLDADCLADLKANGGK